MSLIKKLKAYIFKKLIHTNEKADIFKLSADEYLFENKVVRATIKTYEYNNKSFLIFNVKKYDSLEYLINFAVEYNISIDMDQFVIDHCKENPIFMAHEMDVPSIVSSRIFMVRSKADNLLSDRHPVFINRTYLNRDAYEFSLTTQKEDLNHILWRANNFHHAIKFKFDNEDCFFIGEVEYKIVTIKKKKIARYVSKFTLCCIDNNTVMDIFTVYDINSVVCVLKNVFDIIELGKDKEWLLYLDSKELNSITIPNLRYLDSYIDIFKTPLLFHRNSPCVIKKDENNFKLHYIDGARSAQVHLNISRKAYQDVSGFYEQLTKAEINVFFSSILDNLSKNVFNICARSPSTKLLYHLHDIGFEDCKVPLDYGTIEVLKMHDY